MVPNTIKVPVPFDYVFPHGALCLGVEPVTDFDKRGQGDDQARGLAPPAAALSTSGNGEAQAVDLGFCAEPPDGIEPSTYALRVRRSSRLS